MSSAKLFTFGLSHHNVWANKILITATITNTKVKIMGKEDGFEYGVSNKTEDFKKRFPMEKCFAFEDGDVRLSECDAVLYHLCKDTQFEFTVKTFELLTLASHDLHMIMSALCYPTLGLSRPDKNETSTALSLMAQLFSYFNDLLTTHGYLCGTKLTVCDISVFCELIPLYELYMDEACRSTYPALVTWLKQCATLDVFKHRFGSIKECEKIVPFNHELYSKYHKSEGKGAKEPAKKTEKVAEKKVEKKVAPVPVAPKVSPTAVFTSLPPTNFELEEWKRKYINAESLTDAMTWLWANVDHEGFSFWHGVYKFSDELAVDFMISNLMNGFFERVEKLRKFSFGVMYLAGLPEGGKGNFEVSCVWMFRGKSLAFDLNEDWCQDSFLYEFRQLNPSVAEDKHIVEDYFTQKPNFRKFPLYEIYLFH